VLIPHSVHSLFKGYRDVHVESFSHSFRTGMAFLALVDKFVQDKSIINYDAFKKETQVPNLNAAFELAEKHLGIPKLLDAQEVSDGNVDERSLVLYVSLYFHAFVAKEQQRLIEDEKNKIEERMKGLQGSLEERARLAQTLGEENLRLKKELDETRDLLKREADDNLLLRDQLDEERKRNEELAKAKSSLEQQVTQLLSQVADLTSKLENEMKLRKEEKDKNDARNKTELKGLGVLKKNLEEHIEDLHRWQRYLDFDKLAEVDFSGEIRPQIMTEIRQQDFDAQLDNIAKRLDKENVDLVKLLKLKEEEKAAEARQAAGADVEKAVELVGGEDMTKA